MSGMLEVITTDQHFIFHQLVQSEHALWLNRVTGEFSMRASWDLAQESNPECLGAVWGLVGKLKVHPNMEDQLVVIKECEKILELPTADLQSTFPVYKVKSVALLAISGTFSVVTRSKKPNFLLDKASIIGRPFPSSG